MWSIFQTDSKKKTKPKGKNPPAKGKKVPVANQPASAKKKKLQLKFTIDCSRPVEDGIMTANDFVSKCLTLRG